MFEGFNTYRQLTGDAGFDATLIRAADRMVRGTLADDGRLVLPDIIEIGEYAHFAMLAYKTTGLARFRRASEGMLAHILRNFEAAEGFWCPYDRHHVLNKSTRLARTIVGAPLRAVARQFPLRGRVAARVADHLLPLVARRSHPQYAMSLMDAELLVDTLDGSCAFPALRAQTARAVRWAVDRCAGPFSGSLVESKPTSVRDQVYPVAILNDSTTAATWPTACLLIAYCGLNEESLRHPATAVADHLLTVQDTHGGFFNFRNPDGTFRPLQSGNVNFYVSMALWLFADVYATPLRDGSASTGNAKHTAGPVGVYRRRATSFSRDDASAIVSRRRSS